MSDGPVAASRRRRSGRWAGVAFPPLRDDVVLGRPLAGLLALSAAVAIGVGVSQVRAICTGGVTGGGLATGLTCLVAAAQVLAVPVLLVRCSRAGDEARVWRHFLVGVLVVAATGLAAPVAAPLLGSAGYVDVALTAGALVACFFFYQALIHWNRVRTLTSDPSDWLNGASSVFALAALLNLLPGLPARFPALPGWQVQLLLFCIAGGVMLLGTSATVTRISGLARDARAWWVTAVVGVVVATQVACLVLGDVAVPLSQTAWLLCGAVLGGCALLRPGTTGARPAENQSTVIGALVVLVAGVVAVFARDVVPREASSLVTVYAAIAVLGSGTRIVRLVEDLSHLARTRHEARTDELTGIANRRGLIAAIHQSLATASRTTLLVVDLDRFKSVNDRHGHAVGDQLLRELTAIFAGHVPRGGLLARLGGDEFAVLLHDTELADAIAVADALARTTAPLSPVRDRSLSIEASVGVASSGTGDDRVDGGELMRRADVAMYRAKRSGAGVGVYDGAADLLEQERMRLVEDLGAALAQPGAPQIAVFFQPQVAARTGRVTGAEALVRWNHAELGMLPPDRFVGLAEANGLMAPLTTVVLRAAAAQAARWRAAGHQLRVSVNLSTSCLGEPALSDLIDEVLGGGLDPRLLVLEITETSLMKDPERALEATRLIAERGVGISIDDYGTGYSSLSYLNDLPAAELKIDKSFVGRAVADPRTAAIIAGTVDLAHRLGLRLVAEGVADAATLSLMADLGCDQSQGFLHSRPLPADTFLEWLHTSSGVLTRRS
jgi:diguanylate cyclase (GGDEF)-like protein